MFVARLHLLAVIISALALVATFALLLIEPTWADDPIDDPKDRFFHGSIGTEIAPAPVIRVLPKLFPQRFQPAGPDAGDWIEQFGFVRAPDTDKTGLPYGFAVSHHRPKSGLPTPVPFVGFACALCHTAEMRTSLDEEPVIVTGMGNHSLDLFAFVDALLGALADERLTLEAIDEAHKEVVGRGLTFTEKTMIRLWLPATQEALEESFTKFESPFTGKDLRDSHFLPNGPSRTQAFRELVRLVLDRPATFDRSYSKLPPIYLQKNREWAQFDGSMRSPLARSVFAAIAAGAQIENLSIPSITANVTGNIDYSMTLLGPKWQDVFPKHAIDTERAARGQKVYQQHCYSCHGRPGDKAGDWVNGPETGVVMPYQEIGTDPERVTIRHYTEITDAIFKTMPEDSPLRPSRNDIRPGPMGHPRGFINAPLESAFTRVPYLHNGSVPTMAELINLVPRREVFYRGRAMYDVEQVGLVAPDTPSDQYYYRFDTKTVGNSNKGHDFPWTYKGPGWDEEALRDLLEYLKTL